MFVSTKLQLSARATRRESIPRRLVRPGWSVTGAAGFPAHGACAVSSLHTTPKYFRRSCVHRSVFFKRPHSCPFEDFVFYRDGQVHDGRSDPGHVINVTRNPCSWTNGRSNIAGCGAAPIRILGRRPAGAARPARHVDGCAKRARIRRTGVRARLSPRSDLFRAWDRPLRLVSRSRGDDTRMIRARPACRPRARRRRVTVAILPAGRRVRPGNPHPRVPTASSPGRCVARLSERRTALGSSVPSRRPSVTLRPPREQDVARIAEVSGLSPPRRLRRRHQAQVRGSHRRNHRAAKFPGSGVW